MAFPGNGHFAADIFAVIAKLGKDENHPPAGVDSVGDLVVGSTHVAVRGAGAGIRPGTDRVVTFNGSGSVKIGAVTGAAIGRVELRPGRGLCGRVIARHRFRTLRA